MRVAELNLLAEAFDSGCCTEPLSRHLTESLPKTGPLRFGSENQFPLNFAHEYILVQK